MPACTGLRDGLIASAIVVCITTGPPPNQKTAIGATPTGEPATAMVAIEEGIFRKHGIDATYTLITINPSIPPALLAGSLQIGVPTPTTFLQAIDGGVDPVGVAGGAAQSQRTPPQIIVRTGRGVKEAQEPAGEKNGDHRL